MIKGQPTPGKIYWFRSYPSVNAAPPLRITPVVLISAGIDTASVKVPYLAGQNGREIHYAKTLAELENLFDTKKEAVEAAVVEYVERILNEANRIENIMRVKEVLKKQQEPKAGSEAEA